MILARFRRKRRTDRIERLYGAIVSQARQRGFYAGYAVPDTIEGRFELVVLHTVLLLDRLTSEGDELRELGQAVFDRFCLDMDDNLREMGVGDLSVPKQMRRIAAAFYGRANSYRSALTGEPDALVEALRRNIYGEGPGARDHAMRLADYVRAAAASLRRQTGPALIEGRLEFPALPTERRPHHSADNQHEQDLEPAPMERSARRAGRTA
jgi:cytochrome b pre-mRNA-processing protein 3